MMEEESLGVNEPVMVEEESLGVKEPSEGVAMRRGGARRKTRRSRRHGGGHKVKRAKTRGKKSSKKAKTAKADADGSHTAEAHFDASKVEWQWPNTFAGRYCPGTPGAKGTLLWIAIVRSFMDVVAPNLVGRSKSKKEARKGVRFFSNLSSR